MSRRTPIRSIYRHWPILIPAVLVISVFHAWFVPGLILGADWVRRVPGELNTFSPWPHVWNDAQQLGENDSYDFNYLPLFSIIGLCSRLHVSWNVIERVFFLWPYVIASVLCPYVFVLRITRSTWASAVATCVWYVNTWIIMAAERGAIPSLVAASLMPLFYVFVLRLIDKATMKRALMLAILISAILLYDLRYVYIALFFAGVLATRSNYSATGPGGASARRSLRLPLRRLRRSHSISIGSSRSSLKYRVPVPDTAALSRLYPKLAFYHATARALFICRLLPLGSLERSVHAVEPGLVVISDPRRCFRLVRASIGIAVGFGHSAWRAPFRSCCSAARAGRSTR